MRSHYNFIRDFIASKMIGNAYEFYKDCCGHLVVKKEITKIKLGPGAGGAPQNQSQQQFQAKDPFTFGTWYRNTYLSYCACWMCCSFAGHEVEMNNERVAATKEPKCFEWCGPYPVEDKQNTPIGELVPHCYICLQDFFAMMPLFSHLNSCFFFFKYITNFWHWWHPCCAYLEVKNSNMATVYNINRLPCTCCCCTKW